MAGQKYNGWRKPWVWVCISGVGLLQLLTVNTAPFDRVPVQKHEAQRVPASVEPLKVEITPDRTTAASPPTPEEASTDTPALGSDERVIVMAWNIKALAREGSDYDRAALVLADADIVVLHEMDITTRGKGVLNILAGLMETKTKKKYCRAWTQAADGTRMQYGFMWREAVIGFMEPGGLMHEDCAQAPFVIRQDKGMRHGVHASFYSKAPRKMFELAAVLFSKKPQGAAEVNDLFRDMSEVQWPVVVASDFKVSPHDTVMTDVTQNGYRFAIDSGKRSGRSSLENFWYRNGALASSGTVNLYQRFGDSRRQDIEKGLSDLFPIAIELRTQEGGTEEMSSALVAKSKAPPKQGAAKEKVVAKSGKSKKLKGTARAKTKAEKSKAQLVSAKEKQVTDKEESLEDEESNVEKAPVGD